MRAEFQEEKADGSKGRRDSEKDGVSCSDAASVGKGGGGCGAERKCRPNRSDRRKMRGKKESRAQCREHTHKWEKGKITSFFDRNKQERRFGTVLTAGEGVRAKGGAFPLMRRRMPRIRRIFYKKGEKFAQIFPPTVCLSKYSTFLRL